MRQRHGFTLLEIVITLVVGAVLAGMMLPFLGQSLVYSGFSVQAVRDNYHIVKVVETVTAAYRQDLQAGSLTLSDFKDGLSGYDADGVSLSGSWLDYRNSGSLSDSDGDGAYDAQTSATPTDYLLVTATDGDQSVNVLLTQ